MTRLNRNKSCRRGNNQEKSRVRELLSLRNRLQVRIQLRQVEAACRNARSVKEVGAQEGVRLVAVGLPETPGHPFQCAPGDHGQPVRIVGDDRHGGQDDLGTRIGGPLLKVVSRLFRTFFFKALRTGTWFVVVPHTLPAGRVCIS